MEQTLFYGLILGSILALGAIGLSLTYGILNFANFAHGDVMTFGAYFALVYHVGLGWPMWLAFTSALASTALLALAIDRSLYRRFRSAKPVTLLIASVGVALILRNTLIFAWGPQEQWYQRGIQFPMRSSLELLEWLLGWLPFGSAWVERLTFLDFALPVAVKRTHALIILVTLLLVALVHIFLRYTKMGKAMRAMADNADLARISGIHTERVVAWTWVLGSALASAAGIMLAMDTRLQPDLGWTLLLSLFAATILGGIGSIYGALVGGLVIGITSELSVDVLSGTLGISATYKPAVAFLLMIAILLIRPAGILGRGR